MAIERKSIINRITSVLKEAVPEAVSVLYGSEARGEARFDSDIDLLVVLPDEGESFAKRKIAVFDCLYKIELEYDVVLSPLVVLKSSWERLKTPFTVNVANEGILL